MTIVYRMNQNEENTYVVHCENGVDKEIELRVYMEKYLDESFHELLRRNV